MKKPINHRYLDVMAALFVAGEYQQELGRIQLQKYIFLVDTVSLLWEILAPKIGHETYKHGPFDEAINNAVDCLAFKGFVDVVSINVVEKKVDAIYRINSNGVKLHESQLSQPAFLKKLEIYKEVAKQIERRGWKKLKSMVYAEPTYKLSKVGGWGYRFDHSNLLENVTLRILLDFERMIDSNYKIKKENMVSVFFRLLD
jgi:hypothetical protein